MSEAEQARATEGRLLAGRYRLGEVLGKGGMGTVWRAVDETLGRTVAVKELRFPSSIDDEEKRRLITRTLREAKAIARIRNTGAVTVYDVVDEDDRPWIVMELIEGGSLADVIREKGTLTPRRAAEVGLAVLDVLRSAHREGILHRDVKPSNVLISDDGRVVLTDFGIAQVEGDPSITSTGMLVGAPSYISPERARGRKPGPAADMWSLGGLLYACVEGVPPYDKGSAIATLTAVMTEPVEQPKGAGPLETVIYGLLAKDPDQRLDDAGARALLTAVIDAPEEAVAEPEPPADATRSMVLPAQPEPPAEERARVRGALKSVRNAAAGMAAAGAAGAAGGTKASGTKASGTKASGSKASGSKSPAAGPAAAADTPADSSAGTRAEAAAGVTAGSPSTGAGSGSGADSAGTSPGAAAVPGPRDPAVQRTGAAGSVPPRTLAIGAVVVVLAVLAAVLFLTLGDDDPAGGNGKNDKAAAGGTTAGQGDDSPGTDKDTKPSADASAGTGDGQGGGDGDGSGDGKTGDKPSTDPSTEPSTGSGEGSDIGKGAPVAQVHRDRQGFSVGLPAGWSYVSTGAAGSRFTGPGGQKLLIGWTTTPKSNPVADWLNQERSMRRSQYDRIRIEAVDFRSWNAADWEFTYVQDGTRYRSVDRGFVVGPTLGYGIMYTARADDWDGERRRETWQTITRTFKPKS